MEIPLLLPIFSLCFISPLAGITVTKADDVNIHISTCDDNKTQSDHLRAINLQLMQQYRLLQHIYDFETKPKTAPKDCYEIYQRGSTKSGVYTIQPITYPEAFQVYCDMETDGGGWTVFQRREDGAINFERGWEAYKQGFGNLNSEFWLGNVKLHYLTSQGKYEGRVDLSDFEGESRYAVYNNFRVGDESFYYKLILGNYSGDAGDSFTGKNQAFSTFDADHDTADSNCASSYKGAWWYTACHGSNLNGLYHGGNHESYADGINWYNWKGHHYSLKKTEIKVRPLIS